jgi:hypothetical protein
VGPYDWTNYGVGSLPFQIDWTAPAGQPAGTWYRTTGQWFLSFPVQSPPLDFSIWGYASFAYGYYVRMETWADATLSGAADGSGVTALLQSPTYTLWVYPSP